MKKSLIFLGLLVSLWCSSVTGAMAASYFIYVAAKGSSSHYVAYYNGILYQDSWSDISMAVSASYTDTNTPSGKTLAWEDSSFQFDLSAIKGSSVKSAKINVKIYLADSPNHDNTIPVATLNHYGGSQTPTGDAKKDKLTGTDYLKSFTRGDVGKNYEIDVTSLIKADIAKGWQWAAFSINHVTTSGTSLFSPIEGAEGFADLLQVETVPSPKGLSAGMLLLLGEK